MLRMISGAQTRDACITDKALTPYQYPTPPPPPPLQYMATMFWKSARMRLRRYITKNICVFFCPSRALVCCRFPKKKLISGDKTTFRKKTSLFHEIAMFLFVAPINFFKNVKSLFYFAALINFLI